MKKHSHQNLPANADLSTIDDRVLLYEVKENQQAHDEIISRYFKFCKTEAYYQLNDIDQAENVVQDVFMEVLENPKIRRNITLKHHLFIKVIEKCKIIRRNKKRGERCEGIFAAETVYHPTDNHDLKMMYSLIRPAIEYIPEKYREPFRMRWQEKKSNKEIATKYNITVDTAKKRASRGWAKFREYFEAHQIYPA